MLKISNIQRILFLFGLSFAVMVFDPAMGWSSTSYHRLTQVFQTEWVIQEAKIANKTASSPTVFTHFDYQKAIYNASLNTHKHLAIQEKSCLHFIKSSDVAYLIYHINASYLRFS